MKNENVMADRIRMEIKKQTKLDKTSSPDPNLPVREKSLDENEEIKRSVVEKFQTREMKKIASDEKIKHYFNV